MNKKMKKRRGKKNRNKGIGWFLHHTSLPPPIMEAISFTKTNLFNLKIYILAEDFSILLYFLILKDKQ